MFINFYDLLRQRGLKVSLNEWLTLIEAMEKGLCHSSLTEFYYLSRAILVKSEAEFDQFDLAFAEYFRGIQTFDELPEELLKWLNDVQPQHAYDKEKTDALSKILDLEKIRKMMEERLMEQKERHDGGSYWIGTGGSSVFGNSGYNPTGIRVGAEGKNRSALQVVGERRFKDFREDGTLDLRQFQLAFRRLRQYSQREDGPKDELNLEKTIRETSDHAGNLKLVMERPRKNMVKLLLLFDSGGSMWPYSHLCNSLFQAVSKSNHFKDLKIYYFHNCFYERLYTTPACYYKESTDTKWVLKNIGSEYKVIVVGDGAMAPSELLMPGGGLYYNRPNERSGLDWLQQFTNRYSNMVWLNPLPEADWEDGYGYQTIEMISREVPMYRLTINGLTAALKHLQSGRTSR